MVFKAFFMQDGEEHVMNEISRFTKINGCWFLSYGVIKSISKAGLQANQQVARVELSGIRERIMKFSLFPHCFCGQLAVCGDV
jgi:hypothetical protein